MVVCRQAPPNSQLPGYPLPTLRGELKRADGLRSVAKRRRPPSRPPSLIQRYNVLIHNADTIRTMRCESNAMLL